MSLINKSNLRRSSRIKAVVNAPKEDGTDEDTEESDEILRENKQRELELIVEDKQQPTELFAKDDIDGSRMYNFGNVKRKGMIRKANSCAVIDHSNSSKAQLPTLKIVLEKVDLREYNVKYISKDSSQNEVITTRSKTKFSQCESDHQSESESVSEDSEYMPTDPELSNEESLEPDSDVESPQKENNQLATRFDHSTTPGRQLRKGKFDVTYKNYNIQSDQYFESQNQKTVTSSNTLRKLKQPYLTEEKLNNILIEQEHISDSHKIAVKNLSSRREDFFRFWCYIMEEGFSLLLYGLGSKIRLINHFRECMFGDRHVLVVNGFFPSLMVKDILDEIITEILELKCPGNVNDCVRLIRETMNCHPRNLYLVIHNIDGLMLRSNKAQDVLSRLASIPNVRLVASVDCIDSPLIWDNAKRSRFNFFWFDATTLLPYGVEISYETSLMVQRNGSLALSSLRNVFLSLTTNAKSIYILLLKHQLENRSNNYSGMAFKDLYRAAREGFLVSSDLALRSQLTEFIDHKLAKSKRNVDGTEYIVIPLENSLLEQFLEQCDCQV